MKTEVRLLEAVEWVGGNRFLLKPYQTVSLRSKKAALEFAQIFNAALENRLNIRKAEVVNPPKGDSHG